MIERVGLSVGSRAWHIGVVEECDLGATGFVRFSVFPFFPFLSSPFLHQINRDFGFFGSCIRSGIPQKPVPPPSFSPNQYYPPAQLLCFVILKTSISIPTGSTAPLFPNSNLLHPAPFIIFSWPNFPGGEQDNCRLYLLLRITVSQRRDGEGSEDERQRGGKRT